MMSGRMQTDPVPGRGQRIARGQPRRLSQIRHPVGRGAGPHQRHAMQRIDQDWKKRSEKGDEDDALLVGRPQHDRHWYPGNGRDRTQNFGDRKQDFVSQPETPHHQPERRRDYGRQREAKHNPATAQHHMHEEFRIVRGPNQALIDRARRRHVGEADKEHHPVGG